MSWRQWLGFVAVLPTVATFYFWVFWRWFDYWRSRRNLVIAVLLASSAALAAFVVVFRDWVLDGPGDPPAAVAAVGWILVVGSSAFGTVADRQIGFRVRSFTPFFERSGHLDLVTTGAYGVVRHPIYATGIVFQLGSLLITGYPSIGVAAVIFGLGARWFTAQEEQHLVALLDDPTEYDRYRQRVPALLPRLPRATRS